MTAIKTTTPRITLDEFLLLLNTHHPFAKMLGIQMLELWHGAATLSLPTHPSFQRLGGTVAGPMLMGLADLAVYAAVVGATGNAEAVTASLTINFLRKSPPGTIYARARVLKTGRLCAGDVTLTGESSEEPLAHSVSTWSLPRA
ncbi:MAG: thioesterase [Alcaligenaceae bacterium]|nr:MAG: thioesterase [Alcaligenaceae bacterium]